MVDGGLGWVLGLWVGLQKDAKVAKGLGWVLGLGAGAGCWGWVLGLRAG